MYNKKVCQTEAFPFLSYNKILYCATHNYIGPTTQNLYFVYINTIEI
jgi:5'(3')-deoxyribonucleotidase